MKTDKYFAIFYVADDDNSEGIDIHGNFVPIFVNSCHNVVAATKLIMRSSMNANLDKLQTTKLLKVVKSLLPQLNHLPTSYEKKAENFWYYIFIFHKACMQTLW